jgi:hypothetical protein
MMATKMRCPSAAWVTVFGLSIISAVACTTHGLVGVPQRDGGQTGATAVEDAAAIPSADGWVQADQAVSIGDSAAERGTDAAAALDMGVASDTRGADVGAAADAGRDAANDTLDAARIDVGTTPDTRRSDSGDTAEVGRDAMDPVVSVIALGHSSSCAVVNGGVQCWGWNGYGQLGNGTTKDSPVPVQVRGLTSGATALAVGLGYACAVVNGGVQCWGLNNEGQLGAPVSARRDAWNEAVTVEGVTGAATLVAGRNHTCALRDDGTVICWGDNDDGQCGGEPSETPAPPTEVAGLTDVSALAAGAGHTCAATRDGAVRCWGGNHLGQLGDADRKDRGAPFRIVW